MSSACHSVASALHAACVGTILIVSAACNVPSPAARAATPMRVCADPNNLPYSNDRLEGFENRLAALVAADLGTTVQYTWWAQRRGFLRHTLNEGLCDVVMGLPAGMELVRTTSAYYRSTYVFVTRRDRDLRVRSFDDPLLRRLRIGVPLVGDDGASAPPGHALSRRGIIRNVIGYSVYGDYRTANPPARLIDAVAAGDIDVAMAWGPLAGFFAAGQNTPLDVVPVEPPDDLPFLPFAFDIAMAVRRDDAALAARLDDVLERRRPDVDAILAAFHIPRVDRDRGEPR
jgi:mxaJ protein